MSLVSNIIDAVRRIGSPTERSALRRQDEHLAGHAVLERSKHVARLGDQAAPAFHAVVEPYPEEIQELDKERTEAIRRNSVLAESVFEAFSVPSDADPLDKLDQAFERWMCAQDRRGYSDEEIIELLGAYFGEYCIDKLGMKWVLLKDHHGAALAIEGVELCFRGFPYNSVEKRIDDKEHSFFRGVYILLADQKTQAKPRGTAI